MRRGILGSIVALVAGAGGAWGQGPAPITTAGGIPPAVMAGDVIQIQGGPAPIIMPPLNAGPPSDPMGLGPTAGLGPPPGPMYPMPGPYAEPLWQPPPPNSGDDGYGGIPRWEIWGNYALWFNKSQGIPIPLLTTGAPAQGGVLGAPSTLVLAGGSSINYGAFSGMQLGGSFWGDADRRFGMLVDGFYTENRTVSDKYAMTGNGPAGEGSNDIPMLARPFIDSTYGPTSLVLGGPGIGVSSAVVSSSSQTWGVEAAGIFNIYRTAPGEKWYGSVDLIVGYTFRELRETLAVSSVTSINGATMEPIFKIDPQTGFPIQSGIKLIPVVVPVAGITVTAPGSIAISDRFTTSNLFNGTTIGLRNEWRYGMFNLELIGKIGIGDMHQIVEIEGYTYASNTTTSTVAGNSGYAYGGLLANASNIGRYQHDDFAVVPEATLNFGLNLTRSISVYVGYNYMFMNHIVRPGEQINPVVNSSAVPLSANYGANLTAPSGRVWFNQTDYWLMGANFGMAFKY